MNREEMEEIKLFGKSLERLLNLARQDSEILAVILFGSKARGEATSASDVDICLVLVSRRYDSLHLSRKKLEYLKIGELDVHVFQQLPLYIRRRVIKEGKVLFVQDEKALYELAFRTAQAFEDFKHRYYEYLEQVAHVGS
jgi:predicted nucleotidyltransferase